MLCPSARNSSEEPQTRRNIDLRLSPEYFGADFLKENIMNNFYETRQHERFLKDFTPVFQKLLHARGINQENLNDFLNPQLESLKNPYLFADMKKAVDIIIEAVKNNKKIAVYGDYDVDGTTSGFILAEAFRWLKIPVELHIPHRTRDGYGIQIHTLGKMKAAGIGLVISVDCGIRAFEPCRWANENNLDIIVTDHHEPDGINLPEAMAVINPLRANCQSNARNLTGVGIAFKLSQALLEKSKFTHDIKKLLPFVALGMIADMTELTGEARTMVKIGFDEILKTDNLGLKTLCETCISGEKMTSTDVGFQLAPRINAAGRLGESGLVVDLFNARDERRAAQLALELELLNDDRKLIQAQIFDAATRLAKELI